MADPKGYYCLTIDKYWKGGLFLFQESNVDRFFRLQLGNLGRGVCLERPFRCQGWGFMRETAVKCTSGGESM